MRKYLAFGLIVFFGCLSLTIISSAKNRAGESSIPEYTIRGAGQSAASGCYLVRVEVVSKSPKLSDADVASCAVHGVLFRGFSGENTHFEKPLAGSSAVEQREKEFFEDFFKTQAQTFASVLPASRVVAKTDKKRYIISQTVEVHKDQLRKYLQDAGILKSLGSMF